MSGAISLNLNFKIVLMSFDLISFSFFLYERKTKIKKMENFSLKHFILMKDYMISLSMTERKKNQKTFTFFTNIDGKDISILLYGIFFFFFREVFIEN